MLRTKILSGIFVTFFSLWSLNASAKHYDVLELPAMKSDLATKSLIYTVKKFGSRYFATGIFGHILYSDDGGDTWLQAEVPVRSSITDIDFPTPKQGWAVGHEGVILHSSDGGITWRKQYDGLRYGQEGLEYYSRMARSDPKNKFIPDLIDEMQFAIDQGADKPLFRVMFLNERQGYVMGAYGMSLATLDGGRHWTHNMHLIENDGFLHIFDTVPLPGPERFFVSGEAGLLMHCSTIEGYCKRVHSTPREGSFFASADSTGGAIVIGGLRGRMFRTDDVGETWTVVEKPSTSTIVDSTRLQDGRLIFVGIAGEILISEDDGSSFTRVPVTNDDRIYTVAEGPKGSLLVGGPQGIRKLRVAEV